MQIKQFKKNSPAMSSKHAVVTTFNSLNLKKILSISEMEARKEYVIEGAHKTSSKYGNVIVLELGDKLLYLPRRYNSLDDGEVECISRGPFSISKIPLKEGTDNSLCRLEIRELLPADSFFPSFNKY